MDINYKGETFTIDDYLVNKRKKFLFDTDEEIESLALSFLECEYPNNIEFFVKKKGRKTIESDINDYLCIDLELCEPVKIDG